MRLSDATREPDILCPCKEFREDTDGADAIAEDI